MSTRRPKLAVILAGALAVLIVGIVTTFVLVSREESRNCEDLFASITSDAWVVVADRQQRDRVAGPADGHAAPAGDVHVARQFGIES